MVVFTKDGGDQHEKQRTEQAFPFDLRPASCEEAGFCHPDGTALTGRVTYASGEQQEFADPEAYLQTIREELPYRNTTGFLVAAKSAGLRLESF